MTVSNDLTGRNVLCATVCASAVLAHFGVAGTTWNKRTGRNVWADTLRRAGFAVRSRLSKLGRRPSVGGSRSRFAAIAAAEPAIIAFVVVVKGHALLVGRDGQTAIDTAPRKRDGRKVVSAHAVWSLQSPPVMPTEREKDYAK